MCDDTDMTSAADCGYACAASTCRDSAQSTCTCDGQDSALQYLDGAHVADGSGS